MQTVIIVVHLMIVSVLIGAVLVFFVFPRREREDALRASYHAEDTRSASDGRV